PRPASAFPRSLVLAFAICIFTVSSLTNASAQNQLFPNQQTYLGTFPATVELADLDGDSDLDAVVGEHQDPFVTVVLNNGSGGWSAPVQFAAGFSGTRGLVLRDFNGDAKIDIIASNSLGNAVSVMLGNGNGTFGAPSTTPVGSFPEDVGVADFNFDGILDAVVACSSPVGIHILSGDGAGGFSAVNNYTGPQGSRLSVADVNADGRPDVVSNAPFVSSIAIYYGAPVVILNSPVLIPIGGVTSDVVAQDFSGDGIVDIAATASFNNWIAKFVATSPGTFGSQNNIPISGNGFSLTCADVNGDAKPDFLVALNGNIIDISINAGAGFLLPTQHSAGSAARDVAVGDLNNDSLVDIVASCFGSGISTILQAAPGVFPDSTKYFAGSWARAIGLGDFNEDGNVDAVTLDGGSSLRLSLGNSSGGFLAPAGLFTTTPSCDSLVVADFNNDHNFDVIVTGSNPGKYTVHLGNGTGSFTTLATTDTGGLSPRDIAAGDVNVDGKFDILIANVSSNNASQMLGFGNGLFTSPIILSTGGTQPYGVAIGDLNNDGYADAAIANNSGNVGVSLSNGHILTTPTAYAAGYNPNCALIGDFTGDGASDLAVGANVWTLFLYQGFTSGPITMTPIPSLGAITSLACGDVNLDGNADLIGSNLTLSSFTAFLANGAGGFNTSAYVVPLPIDQLKVHDTNADGKVEVVSCGSNQICVTSSLIKLPAATAVFGAGTPGSSARLGLGANSNPNINNSNFRIVATNAPTNSIGFVVIADTVNFGGTDPFGLNITLYPELLLSNEILIFDIFTDAGGTGSAATPIPNNASIVSQTFFAQGVFAESPGYQTSQGAFFLVTTRALAITVQP
ncbi:MAG: FG-GAP repeat domain-containing protein, partial [Planctomycetota bacterium]